MNPKDHPDDPRSPLDGPLLHLEEEDGPEGLSADELRAYESGHRVGYELGYDHGYRDGKNEGTDCRA